MSGRKLFRKQPEEMLSRKVREDAGFTLIELMIVVAIVGILAAIAIPAYNDYVVKSKITEVTNAFDALATAVTEYHASMAYFPDNYPVSELAAIPSSFGWCLNVTGSGATSSTLGFEFDNTISQVNGCTLYMYITYNDATGYSKAWGGNLPIKYMPKR